MSWDKGFDFRSTSAFVTDPANCTYELASDYPVTRNGVTFGWEDSIAGNGRNRNSGVDARVAGVVFGTNNNAVKRFRIDLPASGDYDIWLARGDAGNASNNNQLQIFDDVTQLQNYGPENINAGRFVDANGVLRISAADWAANNKSRRFTFASTTLRVKFGLNNLGGATFLAHFRATQVAAATFNPAWRGGVNRVIGAGVYVP